MIIEEKENKIFATEAFDNQHKKYSDIPKDLPQPPFSLLLVGPKGSGKSNLILNLVYKVKPKKLYRHFFDKVYTFSPTWKLDPKMAKTKVPDDQNFEDTDSYRQIIKEQIGIQSDKIEEEGKENTEHILMIFTNLTGQKHVFSQSKEIMNKLAFNLRQFNQAFGNNFSGVIMFSGISNRLEIQKIYDEYLGEFNKKEQHQLMDYCFDKPFDFLYINYKEYKLDRFYHNLNKLIITKNKD